MNDTNQMEVNRISAQLEGLTTVVEIDVLNPRHKVLHAVGVHHDVRTILILVGEHWITSVHDISAQQTDLSSHFDPVGSERAETLDARVVLELEGSVDGDQGLLRVSIVNSCDDPLFSLSVEVSGGCDDDAFADLPVDVSD